MNEEQMGDSWGTEGGTPVHVQRILQLKKEGTSLRKIALLVGKGKSQVHRVIQKNRGGQKCSGGRGQSPVFEIHDYHVSVKILEKPPTWEPNTILHFKKQEFEFTKRNGWEEYFFVYNDCNVHITPYKILLFPPKIQSKISAEDAKAIADNIVTEMIPKVERLLEIKLSARPCITMKIKREHAVLMHDKIFDVLKGLGFESLRDDKGNIRLILDRSNGAKHIEGVNPIYADSDIDRLNRFLKEVITEGHSLGQLQRQLHAVANGLSETVRLQKETAHGMLALTTFLSTISKQNTQPNSDDKGIGDIPNYIN